MPLTDDVALPAEHHATLLDLANAILHELNQEPPKRRMRVERGTDKTRESHLSSARFKTRAGQRRCNDSRIGAKRD